MIEKLNRAIQKHITVTGREPKCIIMEPEALRYLFSATPLNNPVDFDKVMEEVEEPYIKYNGILVYRSTDVRKGEVIVA